MGKHTSVLEMLRRKELNESETKQIFDLLGIESQAVLNRFFPPERPEEPDGDTSLPAILLSSFEGCKGLSAGHVFIVGLNEGVVPRLDTGGKITDEECCKFIVALTRARKSLFLLSNKWDYAPKGQPASPPSPFLKLIPSGLRRDGGYLTAPNIDAYLNDAY